MHQQEEKERPIRCRTCGRILATIEDINQQYSRIGSWLGTCCAKEERACQK